MFGRGERERADREAQRADQAEARAQSAESRASKAEEKAADLEHRYVQPVTTSRIVPGSYESGKRR